MSFPIIGVGTAKRDIVQASLGRFTSKRSDCGQIELLVNLGKQSA